MNEVRRLNISGATVYKGIMGFGEHRHLHGVTDFHVGALLPVTIEIVDTPEKIQQLYPFLENVFPGGKATIVNAEMIKLGE